MKSLGSIASLPHKRQSCSALAWFVVTSLVLVGLSPPAAAEEEVERSPYGASAIHTGGSVLFNYSKATVDGESSDAIIDFSLDGEIGYFLIDGLKVSGVPFFTVTAQGEVKDLVVGAAVGLSYYLELGSIAPFVRARGGMMLGARNNEQTGNEDLKGFVYGGGLGLSTPLNLTNIVELGVDYLGTSLTVDGDRGSLDGSRDAMVVHIGYLMVF